MPPSSRGRGGVGRRASRRGVRHRSLMPFALLALMGPPLLIWMMRGPQGGSSLSRVKAEMPSNVHPGKRLGEDERRPGVGWAQEEDDDTEAEADGEASSSPETVPSAEIAASAEIAGDIEGGEEAGPGSPGFPLGEDDIHVVFSSDCSSYQAWQAVVLFHSAILAEHFGPITQLVSGCNEEEQADMIHRHELTKHSPEHKLFFTESFSIKNPVTGESYPYMNKPNAMLRWIKEIEIPESIIALIDPDFLFLKPLTPYLDPQETVVRGDGLSLEGLKLEKGAWVREGHPSGQRFALPNWTHWDRTKFCPEGTPCATGSISMAKRYFDLIPPYLAHREDWRRILPVWVDQAPKVYQEYPSLLAEQTAYSTACATLDLKHYRINNYAIENEKVDYELWDSVDHDVENVCDVGIEPGDNATVDIKSLPVVPYFIHYCHMYRVGHWLFNKRRYRKEFLYDQLSCQTPLLSTPPMDIQDRDFKMHPDGRYESITPRSAKRNSFMLCMATHFVNSALRRFKEKVCTSEDHLPNYDQIVRIA